MSPEIPYEVRRALEHILDSLRSGVYRNIVNLDPEGREGRTFSAFLAVESWLHLPEKMKFPLGATLITPGAQEALAASAESPRKFLRRHADCDWGDVGEEDRAENDKSLVDGLRLLSAYRTQAGEKLWVITEADRSATTILLPEEY